jgi:hypothetical protein
MVILFSVFAEAVDTFKDKEEIKEFTEKVMKKAGAGKLEEALKTLRPYLSDNDIQFQSNVDEALQLRKKFAMQYGPPIGYAFVSEKKIGTILYSLKYLEIAEKQALVWFFYFLKVKDGWRLDEFDFSDRLSSVFMEN